MIAILLSAYNGAKYIREQLDSLLSQTCQDFVVNVRVDGSADGTKEIVDEYAGKYPGKVVHVDVDGKNLGCGQSFMWLLENADADYYMYCDQDDVWLPTKIEETLAKMKEHDETGHGSVPCVVFTDALVTDGDMNVTSDSLWRSNHRDPENAKDVYRYAVYRQAALGCTMMFNNEARRIALTAKDMPCERGQHDRLIVYLCARYGRVEYVSRPLIKYRQHGDNVTSFQNRTVEKRSVIVNTVAHNPMKIFRTFDRKFGRMQYLPFKVSRMKIFWMMCMKWMMPKAMK